MLLADWLLGRGDVFAAIAALCAGLAATTLAAPALIARAPLERLPERLAGPAERLRDAASRLRRVPFPLPSGASPRVPAAAPAATASPPSSGIWSRVLTFRSFGLSTTPHARASLDTIGVVSAETSIATPSGMAISEIDNGTSRAIRGRPGTWATGDAKE